MADQAAAIERADSTDATMRLLRELRRAHARKQVANLAYYLYLAAFAVLC
jgi:hypothetical protein